MIIKFSHGITKETEKWEVFGDIERYSFCPHVPTPKGSMPTGRLHFIDDANENPKWDMVLFTKGMTEAIAIVVHSPVFIINEYGRTVDRI